MLDRQPPVVSALLYKRIAELRAEALARNMQSSSQKHHASQAAYIYTQLKEWMIHSTPDQLKKRYSTKELICLAKLNGKHREEPSFQQVAKALRMLGFESKRNWTNTNRNQRYWLYKEINHEIKQ